MTDTTPDYAGIIAQVFDDLPTDDGGVPWGEVAKARDEATRIVRTLLERNKELERLLAAVRDDAMRLDNDYCVLESKLAKAMKVIEPFARDAKNAKALNAHNNIAHVTTLRARHLRAARDFLKENGNGE